MSVKLDIFKDLEHEQVIFCNAPDFGLRAIIAIHSTILGPALGGTRMWPYRSEAEALEDVLRLSKGMTYKSAAAGLNFGGGKAVIIGDPQTQKSENLFRTFGAFVERLQGQFLSGEDVGVDVNDMEFMFMETQFVVGLSDAHGGSGDPSPMTAYGVIQGMHACIERVFKQKHLKGLTVAIQGLGHVGYSLAEKLTKLGVVVIGCDLNEVNAKKAHKELGIEVVSVDSIYEVQCDIFAPCALGGILNEKTIPKLKCAIVAGSANNQLKEDAHAKLLQARNILYAPDYMINAGGLINVALELEGYSKERARIQARNIYYNLKRTFEIAEEQKILPHEAADRLAEERIRKVARIPRSHCLAKDQIKRHQTFDIKKVA
ncbi:MAG: Glu/Leu/Phe/Val dehydrogenase [Deltaproteobacteria bacterium]|nr:Glu/Leu/Phe/Val dehydrogenase [Deltaproteobacteria bacterium]